MLTVEKIPLTKIDVDDTTFLITFMPDLEPLVASIKLVGLLEPLILREKTDKTYQIVCGFKRVEALRLLAIGEAAAFVYQQGELDDFQALLLTIGHNLTRSLNLVEKAQALEKLLAFGVPAREAIDRYLPLFALQPHMSLLKQVIDLLALESGLREYLVGEGLSLSAAAHLLDLDQEGQKAILSLLAALRPGENRIKEIISFLREISLRDGQPILSLLSRKDIVKLLADWQTPRPQRLEQLRRIIKQMRFPLLTAMEERFAAYKQSISLPPQISFHHPPFIEGEEFRMELRFKDFRSFRTLVASLCRVADAAEGDTDPLVDLSRSR
ncbi:MAG: ParB/RepB/Spo0J family partition protein [Deltaproteobacteria bacterium]|nr:ParB/RepB/Spo0J family partition protein [Deltaproteobacteria bacterium]